MAVGGETVAETEMADHGAALDTLFPHLPDSDRIERVVAPCQSTPADVPWPRLIVRAYAVEGERDGVGVGVGRRRRVELHVQWRRTVLRRRPSERRNAGSRAYTRRRDDDQ